jgi:hypothetical protein
VNRLVSYYQDVAKKLQQLENLPVVQFFSSACSTLPRKDHNFLDEVNRRVWDIKQARHLKPNSCPNVFDSVADPDPPDPHVFGPPGSGSGSISQRYGSGSGSGSFCRQAKKVGKTISQMYGSADPDPDPPQNVIHPKMSWIRNNTRFRILLRIYLPELRTLRMFPVMTTRILA